MSALEAALARAAGLCLQKELPAREVALAALEAARRSGNGQAAEAAAAALLTSESDPRLHRIIALARAERGDGAGALEHFREAVPAAPGDVELRLGFARAEEAAGDPVAALREFRAALEASSGAARAAIEGEMAPLAERARVEEGRRSAWEDARRRAAALVEKARDLAATREEERERRLAALRGAPPGPAASLALGRELLSRGRLLEAEEHLRRAATLDPQSGEALLELGRALFRAGRSRDGDARAALEEAARLLPRDPRPLLLLGDLRARRAGRLEARFSDEAGGIPAFDLEGYVADPAGGEAARRGAEEALALHRRAVELSPLEPRAKARVADDLLLLGQVEEALAEAQAAASRGHFPDARRVLASALLAGGKGLEAEEQVVEFLSEAASGPRQVESVVRMLRELGYTADAVETGQKGVAEAPADSSLLLELGRALAVSGCDENSPEMFRVALALDERPGPPSRKRLAAVVDLAEAVLDLGRAAEALGELRSPLEALRAEEARLRGTRLPRPRGELRGEVTAPASAREEPVDFGNGRDRAFWARVRLLSGRARLALRESEAARKDLAWAARCLFVEKGQVLREVDWKSTSSSAAFRIGWKAVTFLAVSCARTGELDQARRARELGRDLQRAGNAVFLEQCDGMGSALQELKEALR